MNQRIKLLTGFLLLAVLLAACGGGQPDIDAATAFGEEFLGTMSAGEYEAAYAEFAPSFVERLGLTAEQLKIVMPPVTFHSFDYVAAYHELEDLDGSVYTVVRMDGTLTSKIGTPLHLVLDVVNGADGALAIDGWVVELAEAESEEIKNAAQFVMLSLYLSDFEELEKWSAAQVSIEGAEAAFPQGFIQRFDVLDSTDVVALNDNTGLLPIQVVDIVLEDGLGVRVALFWVRENNAWLLQGFYSCPAGGFGGVCDMDRVGNE